MNVKKDALVVSEIAVEKTTKVETPVTKTPKVETPEAIKKRMELVEKIVNAALKSVDNLSNLRERRYKLTPEQIELIVAELKKQTEETVIKLTSKIFVNVGRFKL